MLVLHVREGEVVSQGQWVYAWIAGHGVVYVGATALHPETRTWLHLHDADPEVGRLRSRYAEAREEELEVVAMPLPNDADRQRIRHGAVRLLGERGLLSARHVCDPPLEAPATAETEAFVAAVSQHLG
jgi:hypothetical protein